MINRLPGDPALPASAFLLLAFEAHAEPYLAVQTGFKCGQCHVNPTGGGERTVFGNVFAQTQLAANHLDTGSDVWTGEINRFLSIGGDLRAQVEFTKQPGTVVHRRLRCRAGSRLRQRECHSAAPVRLRG